MKQDIKTCPTAIIWAHILQDHLPSLLGSHWMQITNHRTQTDNILAMGKETKSCFPVSLHVPPDNTPQPGSKATSCGKPLRLRKNEVATYSIAGDQEFMAMCSESRNIL